MFKIQQIRNMTLNRFIANLLDLCRLRHLDRFDLLLAGFTLWTLLLAGGSAFAAGADQLDVGMQAFRVVNVAGKPSLQPTEHARPGDTIEYRVSYRNAGATPARQVAATLPVPAGSMVYLPDTASPQRVEASLDGKTWAPAPLTRTVTREGRKVVEQVPAREYRFLRWNLGDIPAGQTLAVSARMRVVADDKE